MSETLSKYQKIKAYLEEQALLPESRYKMPTVKELMDMFGASQSPVCRAVRDLERLGIVKTRRGSGMVSCCPAIGIEQNILHEGGAYPLRVLFLKVDYFAESLWNMEHALLIYARQNKCAVTTYRIEKDSDIIGIIKAINQKYRLNGIVMNYSPGMNSDGLFQFLSTLPYRVVFINSSFIHENLSNNITILSLDSVQAGSLCVEVLAKAGHTRIGYIRNEPESDLTRMRMEGVVNEATKQGIFVEYFQGAIKSWESSAVAAEKVVKQRLSDFTRLGLTGIIFFSAMGAAAGRQVLQYAGYKIPDDFSIISEDDGSVLDLLYPKGDSVKADYVQPCRDALNIILGKKKAVALHLYPYKYVKQGSIFLQA